MKNLPLDASYEITGAFHTGGMENAVTCDHCGRLICEVATLESSGREFTVGMDCAKTLCRSLAWDYWQAGFLFRKRVKTYQKKHGELKAHDYETGGFWPEGGFLLTAGGRGVGNHPKRFRYFIQDLISKP